MIFKNINQVIDCAVTWPERKECKEFACDILLKWDKKSYKAYSVTFSNRALTFSSDEGLLSYDVNGNGLDNWIELVEIEK